jgi:hypothetical protein
MGTHRERVNEDLMPTRHVARKTRNSFRRYRIKVTGEEMHFENLELAQRDRNMSSHPSGSDQAGHAKRRWQVHRDVHRDCGGGWRTKGRSAT